jgi:hypothetical protein
MTDMLNLLFYFRYYRSLVDESNLTETMDKQFGYMREEIDLLKEKLKTVSEAN